MRRCRALFGRHCCVPATVGGGGRRGNATSIFHRRCHRQRLSAACRRPLAQGDPLPSWNDGPNKQSIVDFVTRTTTPGSRDWVPVPERIATFDNDGTLWTEQPMYFQTIFAMDRVKAMVGAPSRVAHDRAVPLGAGRRPRPARPDGREGHARDHGGLARRADHGGIPAVGARLDRHGAPSALQAAVHRSRLSADARAAGLSARQPVQDLHRLGRRHRVHAAVDRAHLRHSTGAGGGIVRRDQVRDAGA